MRIWKLINKVSLKAGTLRNFLERNKIFFELLSMLVISGAAVWVAIEANEISEHANEIANLEVDMTYSENMPIFSSRIIQKEAASVEDKLVEGRDIIEPAHLQYIITNTGGQASNIYGYIEKYLEIIILDDNTPQYDSAGNLISPPLIYRLNLSDYFTKAYSYYDYSNNTLLFKSNILETNELVFNLSKELTIPGKSVGIVDVSDLRITYTDIYGNYQEERYNVQDGGMEKINIQKYRNTILTNGETTIANPDITAIVKDIKKVYKIEND